MIPTLAGLLLVGKEAALRKYVPAHEVAFQVLRGTDVAVNEFRRWPLLRTLEWALESFQVRNEERELNIGLFRVGVPAYDRRGFREAVNNAFIHRDYLRLGAVHIQMHDDYIMRPMPALSWKTWSKPDCWSDAAIKKDAATCSAPAFTAK